MDRDEISLIKEAYEIDVFTVSGTDPYTIPCILLTKAWMRTVQTEKRRAGRAKTHLWKFVRTIYKKFDNGFNLVDHTYRETMKKLKERRDVSAIKFSTGPNPKFDYELTEYGEAVCKKHKDSLLEQIRLEKWRRRGMTDRQNYPLVGKDT